MAQKVSRNCFDFPAFFPLDREVLLGFLHLIFPAFFPFDREVFWVFYITLFRLLLFIFSVLPRMRLGFFERAGY